MALFQSFLPGVSFQGFAVPLIEHLVNAAPFSSYAEWREARGWDASYPPGPAVVSRGAMRVGRCALGQQQGAVSHKAALPPLLAFGLLPDAHFAGALEVGARPTPSNSRRCWTRISSLLRTSPGTTVRRQGPRDGRRCGASTSSHVGGSR